MAEVKDAKQENGISHPVNIKTEHEQIVVKKGWFVTLKLFLAIIHVSIGIWIARILYFECLHCTDCNTVVIIFLSIISLGCFINVGLPIEKMSNIKVS